MGAIKSKLTGGKSFAVATENGKNDGENSKKRGKPDEEKGDMAVDKVRQEVLQRTNELRAYHSAPPLQLCPKLNSYAQQWANKLASRNVLEHREPNQYGENLYTESRMPPPVDVSGYRAVDSWYEEIQYYNDYFGAEPDMSGLASWGHFTQLVWVESKRLGVGIALTKNRDTVYIVANYGPAGNVIGTFAANVIAAE